jgi:hypothetical protein
VPWLKILAQKLLEKIRKTTKPASMTFGNTPKIRKGRLPSVIA